MKDLIQSQRASVDDDALIEYMEELDEHDKWSATHEHEDMPDGALGIRFDKSKINAMVNLMLMQERAREMYRKDGITDALREDYAILISYAGMLGEWVGGSFGKQQGGAATKTKAADRRALLINEYKKVEAEGAYQHKGLIWDEVARRNGGSARHMQNKIKIPTDN